MPYLAPHPAHILVVDDDLPTREALALILGAEGYRVTTADNGRAALEQLRRDGHADLIVLDLMMPIMDGWQFRAEQLDDPELADIPAVVCSAAGRLDRCAADLHAAACLDKPVDPDELVAVIRQSCSVHDN